MKSGKINFLEPSGPLQGCNGNSLPYDLNIFLEKIRKLAKKIQNKLNARIKLKIKFQANYFKKQDGSAVHK
jgi:hypothetical protein